jgi:CHAT domain-containing protein
MILGPELTLERVLETDLLRYRLLAFATHNRVGEKYSTGPPGLKVLDADSLDWTFLSGKDIAEFRLDADLVVLSACETRYEPDAPAGDGLGGLTNAFLMAGARNVVVTHWPIISEHAAGITVPLVEELVVGSAVNVATSLRMVMLAHIVDPPDPSLRHPMYWASFFVVGTGDVHLGGKEATGVKP